MISLWFAHSLPILLRRSDKRRFDKSLGDENPWEKPWFRTVDTVTPMVYYHGLLPWFIIMTCYHGVSCCHDIFTRFPTDVLLFWGDEPAERNFQWNCSKKGSGLSGPCLFVGTLPAQHSEQHNNQQQSAAVWSAANMSSANQAALGQERIQSCFKDWLHSTGKVRQLSDLAKFAAQFQQRRAEFTRSSKLGINGVHAVYWTGTAIYYLVI